MKIFIFNFLLLVLFKITASSLEVWEHLGTKTPYRFVSNTDDSELTFEGCTAKKIWQYSRHGTRYPGSGTTRNVLSLMPGIRNNIVQQYNLGQNYLTADEIALFERWSFNATAAHSGDLHEEGRQENIAFGQRMLNRFSTLVPQVFNSDSVIFRSSDSSRAIESALYFARGIYGDNVWMAPTEDDLIRWYKNCRRYQTQVYGNSSTNAERNIYGQSDEMLQVIRDISNKTGLSLTFVQVSNMHQVCAFETAWTPEYISPWCLLFDSFAGEVFQYYEDLDNYYSNAYGFEINYKQSCHIMQDLFNYFSENTGRTGNFLFGHSGGLLKILSYLGLYEPEFPLNGTVRQADRTFKTSKIDAFGSNIAFILYDCDSVDYVATLHQENLIRLPYCDGDLCPFEILKQRFGDDINNCNLERICSLDGGVPELDDGVSSDGDIDLEDELDSETLLVTGSATTLQKSIIALLISSYLLF